MARPFTLPVGFATSSTLPVRLTTSYEHRGCHYECIIFGAGWFGEIDYTICWWDCAEFEDEPIDYEACERLVVTQAPSGTVDANRTEWVISLADCERHRFVIDYIEDYAASFDAAFGADPSISLSDCPEYGFTLDVGHGDSAVAVIGAHCGEADPGSVIAFHVPSGEEWFRQSGEAPGELLGSAVAIGPTEGNDDAGEVVAASWGYVGTLQGGTRVFGGEEGAVIAEVEEGAAWIGWSTEFVGTEMVLGVWDEEGRRRLLVYSPPWEPQMGAGDATAVHRVPEGEEWFGRVVSVGDVDGDGLEDAVIGTSDTLRLVLHGDLVQSDGVLEGTAFFGNDPGAAGDLDGDGLGDVAYQTHGESSGTRQDEVHLWSPAAPDAFAILYDGRSGATARDFGAAMGTVGDPDGDGSPAIAILEHDDALEAEVWLLEGPVCGTYPIDEVATQLVLEPESDYTSQFEVDEGILALVWWEDREQYWLNVLAW